MKIVGLTVLLCLGQGEASTIGGSECYDGYCVGYIDGSSDDWCYLTPTKHGAEYADCSKETCSDWDGYSGDKYCRASTPPKGADEFAGAAGRASGGGGAEASAAEDTGSGWSCPSSWHTSGAPTDADAKAWTAGINIYRCMHDVQFAKWDNAVADDFGYYLDPLSSMQHSNCYDLQPPAGPAGENLFWGSGDGWGTGDACSSWYSEINDPGCGGFPGCGGGGSHGTGHFTAMVWAGVSTMGCYQQPASYGTGLKGCRFKGSDSLDCTTPNMQGCYEANVPGPKKSLASCKAKVQACMGSDGGAGIGSNGESRLFSIGEGMQTAPQSVLGVMMSTVSMAALALALVSAVVVVHRKVSRRQPEQASEVELLEEAPEPEE